jgi:hypothetical protein
VREIGWPRGDDECLDVTRMSKHSYFAYLEKAEALGRLTEITLEYYPREITTTAERRDGSCLIITVTNTR